MRLARHCELKTFLDEALLDRFVCGLHAKATQNRLLTEELDIDESSGNCSWHGGGCVTELQARSHVAAGATSAAADKDVLQVTTKLSAELLSLWEIRPHARTMPNQRIQMS